jgi:hypothetical protein
MAILRRDEQAVESILKRQSGLLRTERNVFGHSPIYLAIGWPTGLQILLAAADDTLVLSDLHDATILDRCSSVLNHAIAFGCIESIKLLANAAFAFDFDWIFFVGTETFDPKVSDLVFRLILDRLRQLHDFYLQSLPAEAVNSLQIEDFEIFVVNGGPTRLWLAAHEVSIPARFRNTCSFEIFGLPNAFIPFGPSRLGGIFHQESLLSETAKILYEAGFEDVDHEVKQLTPLMTVMASNRYHYTYQSQMSAFFQIVEFYVQKGARLEKEIPACYVRNAPSSDDTERRYRVIHRIASQCWRRSLGFGNGGALPALAVLGSTPIWKQLLKNTSSDPCSCACSSHGCRPITLAMKDSQYELHISPFRFNGEWKSLLVFDPQDWNYTLKRLSKLIVLLKNLDGEQLAKDVLRFLTFSALGLTHTCCNHNETFYLELSYSNCWMVKCKDASEINEIRDEEKYLIERLEYLEERFLQDFEEQAVSLIEFLMEHWQKVMLQELLRKDELSDLEKEQFKGIGVRIVEADC